MTLKFSEEHEWLLIEGQNVTVGITHHAQEQLGDLVFVDLPDIGQETQKGDDIAVVESVKAASDVYAPIDGKIIEVNDALNDQPELVNSEAETSGWLFKMTIADPAQLDDLMDAAGYQAFIAGA